MTFTRIARLSIEPLVGAGFIAFWILAEAARMPNLPAMAAIGFAIGLARVAPLVSLALTLVGEGIAVVGSLLPVGSWVHPTTATDWPMYVAALAVPALVVGNGTRRTIRPSLVAALLAGVGLAALVATFATFLTFVVVFVLLAAGAWLLGWGVAGFVRFLGALTRDPLIRVRLHDALSLGPIKEDLPALTPRERDVLLLVADGMSNAQIASALFLSEPTVKSHLRSILSKFNLRSRTEVVAFAWRMGLVRPGSGA